MKKKYALALMLALCLTLCACGRAEVTGGTEPEIHVNTPHPRLSVMCGSWINNSLSIDDFNPCLTLTINEDQTCVVDGVPCTWTYSSYTTDERLVLAIYQGEDCIIDAVLEADGLLLVCHHGKMGMADWRRAEEPAV